MSRIYQQTRVTYNDEEFRITVYDDHVEVLLIVQRQFDHGGSNDTFFNVTDDERADVILDNPQLSSAKSYRMAYSHSKRHKRYA